MGFGCAQDEDHMGRWFFQGLEEGVGSMLRQHVGFVDDIDLIPALHRGQVYLVPDVSHLINAPVAGGIHLDEVHESPFLDGNAAGAAAAGPALLGAGAVHRLCQDAGGAGFSRPPGAAEQIGVAHPAMDYSVGQGGGHVLLANHLVESLGTPLTVEDLAAHGASDPKKAVMISCSLERMATLSASSTWS